jgi:hypothetical protein
MQFHNACHHNIMCKFTYVPKRVIVTLCVLTLLYVIRYVVLFLHQLTFESLFIAYSFIFKFIFCPVVFESPFCLIGFVNSNSFAALCYIFMFLYILLMYINAA